MRGVNMKRLILILSCLCSTLLCFGQDLKEDAEWARVIDYVNSSYVKTFCEKRCQEEDLSQNDVNNYNKGIAPSLEGRTIGNSLTRDELKDVLMRNGFKGAYNKVAAPLEAKYEQSADVRSINNALDLLSIDEKTQSYLGETKESLKKELTLRYTPQVKQEETPVVDKPKKERREKRAKRETQPKEESDMSWVPYVILLVLIAGLFFYTRKRTTGARIRTKVLKHDKIYEIFAENKNVDREIALLKNKIASLESEIASLKKLSEKTASDNGYRQTKEEAPAPPAAPPKPSFPPVFVKNFGEGVLKVVEQSEAQFQLELFSDSSAKFSFCGDVLKALANSDGTFDYVSDKIGSVGDAKDIITEAPGTALKQEEGKWQVVQKAKIKFV